MMTELSVNGIRLAFEDVGDGPAIVLVHGFPLDRSMWQHQMAALNGYRRVALDLRGMGESEAPSGGYSMAGYAADVRMVVERLVLDRVVLCGLSMGGYVVFECLRLFPERIAGVVLMDTRAEADDEAGVQARDAMIEQVRSAGADAVASAMLPKLLGSTTTRERPEMEAQVHRMILGTPVPGMIGALEAMKVRADSRPMLPQLGRWPVLIVCGEEDVITPPDLSRAMANAIPGSKLEVVPRAGHLAPMEQPEVVTPMLHQFLDEHVRLVQV
jgi:pimeloyl-ACP methyl ester carboxylesterase